MNSDEHINKIEVPLAKSNKGADSRALITIIKTVKEASEEEGTTFKFTAADESLTLLRENFADIFIDAKISEYWENSVLGYLGEARIPVYEDNRAKKSFLIIDITYGNELDELDNTITVEFR